MVSTTTETPLVAVVGETASGKSMLALEIARRFNGEIICADSRTIYKGMDIGTAKPSKEEQSEIRHHMLDIVEPGDIFTAADFKAGAIEAVASCGQRGKLPILAGGTGLYIDAVLFNYRFGKKGDPEERSHLQGKTLEELKEMLKNQRIPLPVNEKNPRHLIRLLERGGADEQQQALRSRTLVLGIQPSRTAIRTRIEKRIERMFRQGLRKEVEMLQQKYGWESEALTGIGYREFRDYYEGRASMSQVKQRIVQDTLHLAKRQRTWFKRNPHIIWVHDAGHALSEVVRFLGE